MAEKYTDAFIDSAKQYIHNLRYLAKRDPVTLRDISLLEMLLQVYNWAEWFEVAENDKIKIQKLLDCIYLRNPNLALPRVVPGVYYSNVSTPQTIWTWQRVWDNLDEVTSVGPGGSGLYLSATPSLRVVGASGGTTTFTVASNTSWTAVSNQPWCTVSNSGIGNATVTVNHALNILTTSRTAVITLSATGVSPVTVTVNQAGTVALLSVTPTTRLVAAVAGTTTFSVVTNTTWSAVSSETWCTVTPSGNGNGTLIVTYTGNLEGGSRTAYITVSAPGAAPITVQITQAWAPTNLVVTPSVRNVAKTASTTTFDVSSNTSWVVSSNVGWCTVTPSGSNNGTITATFTENTSVGTRTAVVTVTAIGLTPITVAVVQSGATPSLAVTPSSHDVNSSSGSVSYAVTSNAAWTATSNVGWCTVAHSGVGSASITAGYLENTLSVARTATITFTVVGLSPIQVTLVQQPPVTTGVLEFRQGYIYNWYVITDTRKLTSSDSWKVATTVPAESPDPTAGFAVLRSHITPNYTTVLTTGTNTTGFNGHSPTLGRNTNGVFHTTGDYPAGAILLSPLAVGDTTTPTITTITLSSFAPSSSYGVGFPIRLVKTSTTLTEGQSGSYTGNNGIVYPTKCIGGKEWVVANLIETNYRNGDGISELTEDIDWIQALDNYQGARCSHNNDESTAFVYVP